MRQNYPSKFPPLLILGAIFVASASIGKTSSTDVVPEMISVASATFRWMDEDHRIDVRAFQVPREVLSFGSHEAFLSYQEAVAASPELGSAPFFFGRRRGSHVLVVTDTVLRGNGEKEELYTLGFIYPTGVGKTPMGVTLAKVVWNPLRAEAYLIMTNTADATFVFSLHPLNLSGTKRPYPPDMNRWGPTSFPEPLLPITEFSHWMFGGGLRPDRHFEVRPHERGILIEVARGDPKWPIIHFRCDVETGEWYEIDGEVEVNVKENTTPDNGVWFPITPDEGYGHPDDWKKE